MKFARSQRVRIRNTEFWTRSRRGGLRRTGLAMLAIGVAIPLAATTASAEVVVTAPHTIEVLPGLDIVGLEGYDAHQPITVEVWRDGVKVGSTTSQEPGFVVPDEDELAAPMSTLLEINHDGGACWAGHTPDIIAGDEIRVVTADGGTAYEKLDVANTSVNAPQIEALDGDGVPNDVVMTGRALNADGTPMDLATTETEIVQPAFRDAGVPDWDRRVLLAATTGVPVADGTTVFGPDDVGTLEAGADQDGSWIATWKNLPVPTAARPSFAELAIDGEHNFMVTEGTGTEETGGLGTTIAQPGDASGPAQGCPPGSSYGVKGSAPANVNIATSQLADLTLSGTAYNANAVQVTLEDSDGTTITVPAVVNNATPLPADETTEPLTPVKQTWRATVPMSQVVNTLDDGELTASAVYDEVVEKQEERASTDPETGLETTSTVYTHEVFQRTGTTHTFLKDLVAPGAPTANLAGGAYLNAQHVVLSAQDEIEETVRYRMGAPDVPEPTAGSRAVSGQIAVTATQTLKARSFDRAGNGGPVLTETYSIREAPGLPGQPGRPAATAGDARADLTWTAPTADGGAAVTGYRIRIENGNGTTPFEVTVGNRLDSAITGLANGTRYRFTVAAINRAGEGPESLPSEWVTPVGSGTGPGGPDTTAPEVVRCKPAPNTWGVARSRSIWCRMSERVRGVNARTVRLQQGYHSWSVSTTVRYRPALRRIVINPRWPMEKRSRYTVRLTSGIRDVAGNRLDPVTWSFRTGKDHWS